MDINSEPTRWDNVAQVLVDYAVAVKPDERVLIVMREPETFPAVRAVAARCIEKGALPQTLFYSMSMQRDLLRKGSDSQITWVPELWEQGMQWADVCIDLRGARNLYELSGIPTERVAMMRKAEGVISALRTGTTRWTLLRIPNEAFATQAGMSTDEMYAQFFDSVLQDWPAEAMRYRKLSDSLSGARSMRVVGAGTDLSFSTAERTFIVDDGHINMPGGEVFTSPVEETVNGTISFEEPGVLAGVRMEGIQLTFRDGMVVDASARSNESFLHQILDTDEGSRRVGEFGIGTNARITGFVGDILLDEKILGTVHIALGRSYTECGGRNSSAVHWDIVKDLRSEGVVYRDGVPVFDNGTWHALRA